MATDLIERRSVAAEWEIRTADDGSIGLRGHAALFDTPAHGEVIRSTAFTKTLREKADVRLLVNHDGVPLARTKSGTMKLSTDERGLVVDVASLDPANPTVQELVSAMSRGDIDQMSFAFSPVRESVDRDGLRELREVKLFDVSVVTYPWYEQTSVELNGLDLAFAELRSGAPSAEAVALLRAALDPEPEPEPEEIEEPEPARAAPHWRREAARLLLA